MLPCCSATTEVSATVTLHAPPLSSSLLPVSSSSSLSVAPRNNLISIETHFVQLPYMGEIAGMGPVDYAPPPLCLFYLMPKTADNFKNLGQLIMRFIFFLLSFAALCVHFFPVLFDTLRQHDENASWYNKHVSERCQRAVEN